MAEAQGRVHPDVAAVLEERRAEQRRARVEAAAERMAVASAAVRARRVEVAEERVLRPYRAASRAVARSAGVKVTEEVLRRQVREALARSRQQQAARPRPPARRSGRLSATLGDRAVRPSESASPYAEWFRRHGDGEGPGW
ncbi:hypothetical protein [Nocardioides sp. KR10-350]|uniref:hypothetical protein n=1 Tax=Nocardioides cheoyonin TaxID=3156615 RepID=UPI0032B5DBF5